MIVNYDKNNGWTSFLTQYSKVPEISDKVQNALRELPSINMDVVHSAEQLGAIVGFVDDDFYSFAKSANMSGDMLSQYRQYIDNTTTSTNKLQSSLSKLKGVLGTVASFGINMAATWAISAGVEAIAKATYNWIHADEIAIETGKKAQSNIKERFDEFKSGKTAITDLGKSFANSSSDIKTTGDAIDSIAQKYTELSKGVNQFTNENESLSDENYQSYLNISNQLAEQMPSLVSGYDAQGNAILNLGNNAETAAQSMRSLYEAQMLSANVEIGNNLQEVADGVTAQIKIYENQIDEFEKIHKDAEKQAKTFNNIDKKLLKQLDEQQKLEFDSNKLGTENATNYFNKIKEVLDDSNVLYDLYSLPSSDPFGQATMGIHVLEATDTQLKVLKDTIKSFPTDAIDEISAVSNEAMKNSSSTKMMVDDQWKSLSESLGQYIQTTDSFSKLDEGIQNAFLSNLGNIDLSALGKEYDGEVLPFVYGEFIEPLSNLKPEAQKALSDLFKLDESTLNANDYNKEVFKALSKAFPNDKEMQKKWRDNFGISDIVDENSKELAKLKDVFKDNISDIDAMTNGDRKLAYDLIMQDEFSGTFDELLQKINSAKQSIDDLNANPIFDSIKIADESKNAGDDYLKAMKYLKEAKEMYDNGLTGTDDFKRRAAYLSPTASDDPANFIENYSKATRYLTEDSTGVQNFLSDLESKGFATFNKLSDGTKQWKYNIDDLRTASESMGVGFEFFMDMFGRLEDYGAHNNFVSSVEDGAERIKTLSQQLVEEQVKLSQLEASGAKESNKTAYNEQVNNVNALKNDILETQNAIDLVTKASAENYKLQIDQARQSINSLAQEREKILKENTYGKDTAQIADMMESQIQQIASENGIELEAGFVVSKESVEETAKQYQEALKNASIENPVKPFDIDENSDEFKAYESVTNKIQEAYKNNSKELKNSIEELSKYSLDQLESVNLSDGAYATGLESAEKALDGISDKLGLSKEEAGMLVSVLESMGIFKPEVDDSSIEEAKTTAEETRNSYENLDGSTVNINANLSGKEDVNTFINECKTLPQGISTTITANVSGSTEVDSLISGLKEIPNETPTVVDCTVNNASELAQVQSSVDSLNANGKQIVLNAKIKPTGEVPDAKGKANFTVGESPKKVPDAKGKANFGLGSSPENVPDASGKANYILGNYPTELPSLTQYVNVIRRESGFGKSLLDEIPRVNGTLSSAFANGSAYNVLNLRSAYVGGRVALSKDEQAVVNELGTEGLIRNGRLFAIPGGMHFENLKKGDIILSVDQMKKLFSGRDAGHARAYASGSLTNGFSSYAGGSGGISFPSRVPTTQNTTAQNQNTQATNANTSAKKENTKAAKEVTETFDWVKNKIQVFSKAVETFAKRITEYASYPLKKLNLNRQIGAIEKEINANRKGYETYMNKANSIGISDKYKKLVQSGEFRIEDIDTSTDTGKQLAEDIKKYQNYYNAALECSDAIAELNNKHIELFDTLVNLPIEETEKKVEKLEKRLNSLSSFMSTISSGGSAIHALQKIVKADNPNINKVNSNLSKAKEREKSAHRVRSSASKAYSASRQEQGESKDALTSALSKKTNSAGKLLKKAAKGSTSKNVYRAITNAIKSGNPVDLKGLKGDDLKAAKQYNETLKQQKYVDSKVKAGKGVNTKRVSKDLLDLAKEYNTDTKNMNSAQEAYEKSVDAHNKAKKDVSNAQAKKDSVDRATTAEQRALANLDTSKQSYLVQNDWLDEEIKILKDKNKAYKDAVNKTTSTADKQLKKQNDRQKSLLKNKKFIKSLNKEQLADLKKGEQIDLEGLTGENLKLAEQWNKAVQKTTVALDAQSDALHNLTESEAELAQKLVENEKQKLENISNFYDAFIAQFEAKNSVINSAMGELEAKGYAMSKSFYEAQIAQNQATIKSLEEQRKAMMESFQKALDNDTIQEGTIEYYEMQASIDKVTASLQNAKTEIAQLEKNIRELEWKQFDRLQESIKRIASESDFLIELMSSKELYDKDTGKLTNEGLATMGLHGVNYNTYMQQADKYREEMLKINEQLAKDPHNQELEDRRNELLDLQQQSILAAEKEKLAIKDMVENGIELELDAIDELIDKYLEALEAKRELYNFESKIKKQAEEIASLQKQMSVYMNDNSEEARKKVQQLKENLKEAQENLKETEYDKFIDDQKELLESLRNEYEEVLNKRLDNIDVLIQTTIDEINANSGVIKDTLIEQADKVGYTLTPELQNIWTSTDGVKDVLSAYDGNFTNTMTTLQGTVQGIVDKQQETIKALEEQARQVIAAINSSMTPPTANPDKSESDDGDKGSSDDKKDPPKYDPSIENAELETEKPNKKPSTSKTKTVKVGDVLTYKSGVYYGASDGTGLTGNLYRGKKVKIDRINKESWAKYPYSISSADGKTELGWVGLNQLELKGYKLKGYATGGNVLKNQWANVNERGQELVEYKGATLLPLPGGAEVWNASKTNNVLSDILDPMKAFNKNYGMISGMTNKNDGIGNGTHIDNLSVSLPNVKDGEDFVDYLVNSKKFEKLINTMTVDKMTGRANKLTKYQYRK